MSIFYCEALRTIRTLKHLISIRTLLLFSMLFVLSHASGQTTKWDVILMKNAEVVRGTISDSIPGESITILAGDSLGRIIAQEDIQLVTSEVKRSVYTQKESQLKNKNESDKAVHYQGVLAGGLGFALDENSTFKANFINGLSLSKTFSIGLGLGFRLPLSSEAIVMPLFFDMRIRFMKTKIAPVLALALGGCFQVDRDFEGTGGIVAVELGISVKKSGKSFLMFTVGYESFDIISDVETRLQSTNTFYGSNPSYGFFPQSITQYTNIRTITLNVAVGF